MKMKFVFIVVIISVGFYLSGCEKESSIERGGVVPVVTNLVVDSNYLDKIIYTSTIGNITDTTFTQIYEYDASKRIVSLMDSIKSTNSTYENFRIKYFYNGNDTLPFKKIAIGTLLSTTPTINSNRDTSFFFYQYSAIGVKIKDSILRFVHHLNINGSGNDFIEFSKKIIVYQNVSNIIYGKTTETIFFNNTNTNVGIPSNIYDTALINISGNLILNKKYDDANLLFLTSTFTYDNNPNPFAKLSNYKTITVFPSGESFVDEMQAKNNRLNAIEIGNGLGSANDLTGKYQYNLNGYPKQIVEVEQSGTHKTIFIYKTL